MNPERPTELPPEIAAKLERRKRFPRARCWLFNCAAALSLLLFVGNYWMWLRGVDGKWDYFEEGKFAVLFRGSSAIIGFFPNSHRIFPSSDVYSVYTILSGNNKISYGGRQIGLSHYGSRKITLWEFLELESPPPNAFENFQFEYGTDGNWLVFVLLRLPYWFLQLLFAIYPLWWLGRFALRRAEKMKSLEPV